MSTENLKIEIRSAYWANTARAFMIGPVDGYAVFPALLFAFNVQLWTAALLFAFLGLSIYLNRAGYNIPVLYRLIISRLAGKRVSRMPMIGHVKVWR